MGSESLLKTAISFNDFGAIICSVSARSLCSGKLLASSMRRGEDISFKDLFPELCTTEEPCDKLFCRVS